jgi:hypothetical protein
MKCDACRANIEDYFDRELDGELEASVTAHLSGCAGCSQLFEELNQEQELYARYQRDVEVTPALWAAVEARIKQEKIAPPARPLSSFRERLAGIFGGMFATPRLSPVLAAALVLVAIGITVTVMTFLNSPGNHNELASNNSNSGGEPARTTPDKAAGSKDTPAVANDGERRDPAPVGKTRNAEKQVIAKKIAPAQKVTPEQLVREAQQKYVAAIAILSRDVNRRRSQIDPMVLARFDTALANIDRTIEETRRAVREHPDDPVALQYLLAAYSKKVDVLRDMSAEGQ